MLELWSKWKYKEGIAQSVLEMYIFCFWLTKWYTHHFLSKLIRSKQLFLPVTKWEPFHMQVIWILTDNWLRMVRQQKHPASAFLMYLCLCGIFRERNVCVCVLFKLHIPKVSQKSGVLYTILMISHFSEPSVLVKIMIHTSIDVSFSKPHASLWGLYQCRQNYGVISLILVLIAIHLTCILYVLVKEQCKHVANWVILDDFII